MTSRSHSRSVTTGHKGNLSKVRSNIGKKSKMRPEVKLRHDRSKKGIQAGPRQQPIALVAKPQRSRNEGNGSQLT